ncbi:MAG: iron-containing alcohol dehydrogenase [Desulfovibrio sp.]|jgi:alcohol dehydrogenase class IV|nr:iron-containing alcohol dehydrogenase [Desulfovibrio sp.]
MQFMFTSPTLVNFGRGVSRQLAPTLQGYGVKRVFLVSDKGVQAAGLLNEPVKSLQEAGFDLLCFDEVLPDAPDSLVQSLAEKAHAFNPDALVSIGGGSCIDTAKAINILLANPGPINLYDGLNLVPNPGRLHIAIPTTAGTSSEITVVSVISDVKNAKKMVIFGKNVAASIALVDPELTDALPPALTASTGMDALTHAIEAYISTASSPLTDALAPEAIALIATNLPLAYADGANREARDKIMQGCQLAGVCFSNACLGLVHSLSHPMSAHCHVPHGLANAICLPRVLAYTLPVVPEDKIIRIAQGLGLDTQGKNAESLGREITLNLKNIARTLHIPSIAAAGVKRELIAVMSEDSLKELSTTTTPRKPSVAEVIALYEDLFAEAE